jgi:hypothetical protein
MELNEGESPEEFASMVERGAWEVVGEITDKEYLAWRSVGSIMPQLNRVLEELGIHHEEHKVPLKVLKSIEDYDSRVKEEEGVWCPKATSKRQRIAPSVIAASAAGSAIGSTDASSNDDEEVAENAGGGPTLVGAEAEAGRSTASMDLCGDQFVENAVGNHYCIFITANYSLKRRNKHTFDTYAFTIDLVPLISRENVFCRTTSGNKWKRHKTRRKRKAKRIF